MSRKILVTGGAGFIGSRLVHRLHNDDRFVPAVIDDLSTGRIENLPDADIQFYEGSILDKNVLNSAIRGASNVIHLAAIPSVPRSIADPVASHRANAGGTLCVLEAARHQGVEHVVVASSSSVYGANTDLPKREKSWLAPMSPYAVSKMATEAYANAYSYSYGLQTLAFRFFNVFGPGQPADHAYAAVIPRFIAAALSGQPLSIQGDGLQSRDFTYVETVCDALVAALDGQLSALSPVNLAFGTSTTLLELVDHIGTLVGRPLEVRHEAERVGDVRSSQADTTALARLLPEVKPVDLDVGLRATIEWFQGG